MVAPSDAKSCLLSMGALSTITYKNYTRHIIIILNTQEKLRSEKKSQNTCIGDQIQALSKSQIVLIYIISMYIRYRHWLSVKKDYIQF